MQSSDTTNSNVGWVSIPLKHAPQSFIEINVSPSNFPNGVIVRIPEATHDQLAQTNLLHLRHILDSAEIAPDTISKWKIEGKEEDSMFGWNPAFEQVIQKAKDGADTEFLVYFSTEETEATTEEMETDYEIDIDGIELNEIQFEDDDNISEEQPVTPPLTQSPQMHPESFTPPIQAYQTPQQQYVPQQIHQPVPVENQSPADSASDGTFDFIKGIEADWIAVLQMEKQMAGLRSQLVTTQTSLNSLNRDLSGNEALQADQMDKKNWQDARRWMRDAATKISVSIRDHDIGPTSGAGQRDWFEQMYEAICLNKQPVPNIKEVHQEFSKFRNAVKMLFNSMSSVKASAERDGIQRANRVLNTIRAKKRDPRRSR